MGANRNVRSEAQEIFTVLPGIVRNAADHSRLVGKIVIERGYRAHVDSPKNQRAAFAKPFEGCRNNFSRRGEDNRCVQLNWRLVERSACPRRAQLERQALMTRIAGQSRKIPAARPA